MLDLSTRMCTVCEQRLRQARFAHSSVIHSRKLYIVSGVDADNRQCCTSHVLQPSDCARRPLHSVEDLDLDTGSLSPAADIPTARAGHSCMIKDDCLIVAGGKDVNLKYANILPLYVHFANLRHFVRTVDVVERLVIATGVWEKVTKTAQMSQGRQMVCKYTESGMRQANSFTASEPVCSL